MATTSSGGLNLGVYLQFDKNKAKHTASDIQAYMDELQRRINNKTLTASVSVDPKSKSFLSYANMSAEKLQQKIKQIDRIISKMQDSGRFWGPDGNITANAERLLQIQREMMAVRDKSNLKGSEINKRITKDMEVQQKRMQQLSGEYKKQGGYLQHLTQRMAVYASIGAVMGFLTKIREVTAEFELQRISLGAIIQDQNKANALFSEIKNFALKSPVKILDLTKYTKQLAAYRIETDKLFDTTKRLADISVGLGVDMQRIILFYGQVRAAGYLRASEVRQATEAGIPLVEELAQKLSQARGELVSIGQVMDMISKRQISFQDVADVFEDMTNKGGVFYNMQEKQGNTLYGMWQKLGDAVQVMYDQIGNTSSVNGALKGSIDLLRRLMLAWRDVAKGIEVAAIGYLAFKINSRVMDMVISSTLRLGIATTKEAEAEFRLNEARAKGNWLLIKSAQWKLKAAQWSTKAAQANNIATWSYYKLGAAVRSVTAALAAFWPMLAVTIVASAWAAIDSYIEKANRLKKALDEVRESANIEISKSVQNFESLANAAVNARDGSKEQRDALEELQTTYGKMMPEQDLQIKKLREMAGNYDLLTEAIRNNIAEQKMQEGITTVIENFAPKIKEAEDKIKNLFKKGDTWLGFGLSDEQTDRIVSNAKKLIEQGKDYRDAWSEAFKMEGLSFKGNFWEERGNAAIDAMRDLSDVLKEQKKELDSWEGSMKRAYDGLGLFAPLIEEAKERIANADYTAVKGTFEFDQQEMQESMHAYQEAIIKALQLQKVDIKLSDFIHIDKDSVENLEVINFDALIKAISQSSAPLKEQLIKLVQQIQQIYGGIVPSDPLVRHLRDKLLQISASYGIVGKGINQMKIYLWDGSKSLKDHVDDLEKSRQQLAATIYQYKILAAELGYTNQQMWENFGINLDEEKNKMDALDEIIKEYKKHVDPSLYKTKKEKTKTKKGKTPEDQRLQTWQEIIQLLEKANSEYDKLEKKEGPGLAKIHADQSYGKWFEYVNSLKIVREGLRAIGKGDFQFYNPTNSAELRGQLDLIKQVYEYYQKLGQKAPKGIQKSLLDLGTSLSNFRIEEIQKNVENKLKELSEKISQSKVAKEFYDKILSQTGDVDLAANVTMSIYGELGDDVKKHMVDEILALVGDVEGLTSNLQGGTVNNLLQDVIDFDTNNINYKALEQWVKTMADELGGINNEVYQKLMKIARDGQKEWAKTYEGYLKDLEKAKSYSDKRIELARTTAEEIARIQRGEAGDLDQAEKDRLSKGLQEKEAKEAAQLAYEAFKDSPMYVAMFEDLDYASTTMLENMKQHLQSLQGEWKNLDPQNLKEMQKRLDEINKQLIQRNPFKTLSDAMAKYRELSNGGSYKDAEKNLAYWEDEREKAWEKYEEELKKDPNSEATKSAKELYDVTVENADEAEKLMERWQRVKETIGLSVTEMLQVLDMFGQVAHGIADLTENFGGDEEDVQYWNDIADGLDAVSAGIQDIISNVLNGNVMGIISSALTAIPKMIIGFAQIFDASRIRKANKEIKRQQEILEQLEYTYGRLQNAADKLFGTDYIQNYNQQLDNLQAKSEAYQKQLEAERSKGKKADKDKLKEYENAYIETLDEIADRQQELMEKFTGSTRTDAAREFAQAWLDAKVSFENTADAIKSKHKDMIQNMIIEGAAAKVIDNILAPMWDAFNATLGKGNVNQAIEDLINGMDEFTTKADNAMNVLYQSLLAKGIDLQEILGEGTTDLTGISRDIATASEESINGLAQGINTQNYYISHVPTISENVAAIRILMEGGAVAATGGDLVGMQNEHLAQLPIIAANTLATAERCERAAVACEAMQAAIERVVVFKGNNYVLKTQLN